MTHKERIRHGITVDSSLVVTKDKLKDHKGFDFLRFDYVGITQSDLKKLERKGLAYRGYTQNVFPNEDGLTYKVGHGSRVVWVLDERIHDYAKSI